MSLSFNSFSCDGGVLRGNLLLASSIASCSKVLTKLVFMLFLWAGVVCLDRSSDKLASTLKPFCSAFQWKISLSSSVE